MNQRPFSVSLIGWLFVVTGVIGFTYHMTELKLQIPVDSYAAWVLLVRLLAIVGGAFLLRGANWARWLLISWMAYHVAISTLHSIPEEYNILPRKKAARRCPCTRWRNSAQEPAKPRNGDLLMNRRMCSSRWLFLAILSVSIHPVLSQTSVDPELLAEIQKIRAIDNHSHVLPFRSANPAEGERPDPLGKTPFEYPVRLRVTNPEYVEVWHALYRYKHQDMTADHAREALKAKLRLMQEKGTDYPSWVLDQAGIDAILVNMPSLGPGQNAPRFLWVPRADGFLFPFGGEDKRIGWFRREVGLDAEPTNVTEYLDTIRTQLDKWKKGGALAIKFAIAYGRPLDFAQVTDEEATRVFASHRQDRKLTRQDSKTLEDFLFHFIAREAGRRGLVVQIHTGIGAEPYFNISGSNPMLMETMFNDTALRQTRFVMVHGGWPFEREAGAMLIKPNVYADFSAQVFLRSTEALSTTLRAWMEWYPEKILFGTDAYPDDTPLANWEEKLWLASRTSRQALAIALTGMIKAGQVTRPRAMELARMVLRDNAAKLYGLEKR